jgi:hypothetical protein
MVFAKWTDLDVIQPQGFEGGLSFVENGVMQGSEVQADVSKVQKGQAGPQIEAGHLRDLAVSGFGQAAQMQDLEIWEVSASRFSGRNLESLQERTRSSCPRLAFRRWLAKSGYRTTEPRK